MHAARSAGRSAVISGNCGIGQLVKPDRWQHIGTIDKEFGVILGFFEIKDGLPERLDRIHVGADQHQLRDRKSTRLNSSHVASSYAVFCLKKKSRMRT